MSVSGGEMASEDGAFKLSLAQGSVAKDSEWTLYRHDPASSSLTKKLKPSITPSGSIWEWQADQFVSKNARLTMALDSALTPEQKRQAGVYYWNKQKETWEIVRTGILRSEDQLSVDTPAPGSYAVFVNDVSFADTTKHWAREAIEQLAAQGIALGKGDGNFHPDDTLTRAEFTKMIVETAGLEKIQPSLIHFTDASTAHWANKWIETAIHAGLIQAEGELFHPEQSITREDIMVMLVHALQLSSETTASEADIQKLQGFQDDDKIGAASRDSVAIAVKTGLVSRANGAIKPQGLSSRAEAAVFLTRLMALTEK
jgi:hypothetical protein